MVSFLHTFGLNPARRRGDLLRTMAIVVVAAGAIALLPLPAAALAVAAVAGGVVLVRHPVLGLYGLALLIPAGPLLRLPLGAGSIGLLDLAVAATAGAWFLAWSSGQRSWRPAPLLGLLLPFGFVLLLSTLAASSLEEALPELIKWAEVIVVYGLGAQLITPRHRLPLAVSLIVAAVGESLIGLRQFIWQIGPEAYRLGAFLRSYGTFGQPNPFAGYLGLIFPLALALGLGYLGEIRRPRDEAPFPAWVPASVLLAAGLVIAAGMITSWSRGAWLGMAASSLTVLVLSSATGRLLVGVAAVLLFWLYPLLPPALTARFQDIALSFGTWNARGVPVTDANFAVLERVAHWQAAWAMFADHPWLGIGIGNWNVIYPEYAISPWFDPLGHAHNVLFHVAAEAGMLGALGYLWFWLGSLTVTLLVVRRQQGRNRALTVGVCGLFVHLSVHNQFDNLFVQGMPLVVALALALLPNEFTAKRSFYHGDTEHVEPL
jgi:O-antigen ligase